MIEIKVIHEIHDVRHQQQADLLSQLLPFMEKIVTQLSDLQDLGVGIKADLELIKGRLSDQASSIADLHAQLTQLQETSPPQVDLSPAIEAARAIKEEADAIVSSFGPQEPPVGGDPAAGSISDASSGTADSSSTGDAGASSSDSSSTGGDESGTAGTGDTSSTGSGSTSSADAGASDGAAVGDAAAGDVVQEPGPDQGGGDAQPGDQSGLDQQP